MTTPQVVAAVSPGRSPQPPSVFILALMAAIAPFSIHVILPSLPSIAAEFGVPNGTAQLALTFFLVGIALGQLGHGPLSDRFGRRPVLIAGYALYLAATLLCLFANSVELLIGGRLLQALSGCVGMVLSRAIIRDCYGRDRSAAAIGYVTMAMAACSLSSPAVGGYLDQAFSWRGVFAVLSLLGLGALTLAMFRTPETNLTPLPRLDAVTLARHYSSLCRSRTYLAYALFCSFNQAAWFAFVAEMPFVLVSQFSRPVTDYGFLIVIASIGYVSGNFVAGRFTLRLGTARMIVLGASITFIGVAAMVVVAFSAGAGPWHFFLAMSVAVFGNGLSVPSANAGAISVNPRIAGAAAGLLGFFQMGFAAVCIWLMGFAHDGTWGPVALAVAATVVLGTASLMLLPRDELSWRR